MQQNCLPVSMLEVTMNTNGLTKVFLSFAMAMLSGCAAIKGVTNSNLHAELPRSGTFAVRLLDGDPVVGAKIERILKYQIEKHGYRFNDTAPDLLVSFTFDVVPAGSVSSAHTFINRAPQTAYVWGNTVTVNPSYSTATTVVNTTRLFNKTVAVRISRAATGQKLWDGVVSETGWCNQIFVTAPQILTLMFEAFPHERTNVQKMVTDGDEGPKELRKLFPPDTNWGCARS